MYNGRRDEVLDFDAQSGRFMLSLAYRRHLDLASDTILVTYQRYLGTCNKYAKATTAEKQPKL